MLTTILAIIIAYLIGSLSSAIIVCRLMRLPDPRTQGSGNPGATNVLRIGGKKAALITLLGDALKGFLPVFIAKIFGLPDLTIALIALAAFIGHLFPLYFHFEGGKGVATLIGCLLALNWQTSLCWIIVWIMMAILFRYSSLAALAASVLAPVFIWLFTGKLSWTLVLACMSVILVLRHHSNIKKLICGEENKIGKK